MLEMAPQAQASAINNCIPFVLNPRQLCDLICLMNGAFSPLTSFLVEAEYEAVCHTMRLPNGMLWPIPITLDIPETLAEQLKEGDALLLTNEENRPLARLTVQSKWQPDKVQEALRVFGTLDKKHPGVRYLFSETGSWYIGGPIKILHVPAFYDFIAYRHTPAELKQRFKIQGWERVVAFQTRNPMHRAHFELTVRAAQTVGANLLLHPVVGMTKPGDVDYRVRVKCYEHILPYYSKIGVMLSLLPLAMRMAGPKEALWHAIIRKNYGVTHLIVGRDHAGPGLNSQGHPFYEPYAAQALVAHYAEEVGIGILPFEAMVFVKERQQYVSNSEVLAHETVQDISGTALRTHLVKGEEIPDWFTFKEVKTELLKAYPPRTAQGYTIFFTGLSGAGKSTLAKALYAKLLETTDRTVTLLDGDMVRHHLSKGLGFSKVDRDINILRIGFVAQEITKHGGIAICAAIAPFRAAREQVKRMIADQGGIFEVYVATPLAICKQRDVKGLYQQAEAGLITQFTGVSDPYEVPENPALTIDTSKTSVEEGVFIILEAIKQWQAGGE